MSYPGGTFSDGKWGKPLLSTDEIWKLIEEHNKEYGDRYPKKGEQQMNAYERQSIQRVMNIEYGSAASIEQLIMAQAYFQIVVNQIKSNSHEVPRDLQESLDATTRDLNDKLRADRTRQIRAIELQLEQLMSADEKRTKLAAELAKLKELVK